MTDGNTEQRGAAAEEDVWTGAPSPKAEMLKVLAAVAMTVAAVVMAIREPDEWVTKAAYVAAPVAWVWALICCFYPNWSIHYRLTTQRLFVRRGLLSRTTDQLELIRVDDVRVHQTLLQRLLGLGDVQLISTDATDKAAALQDIHQCESVAEMVRQNTRRQREKSLWVEKL